MIRAIALSMLALSAVAQPLPQVVLPPPKTQTVYAVVTAYDPIMGESPYSLEVMGNTTNGQIKLAWSNTAAPWGTNPITFNIFWGPTNMTRYAQPFMVNVGTNTTATIPPATPKYIWLFDQAATKATGPFSDLSALPYRVITNPASNPTQQLFFRLRSEVRTNAP